MPTVKRATRASNKPKRVPVSGLRDIMTVLNKDTDYVYRWVVDLDERGGRILTYERAGYSLVESDSVEVGADAVYKTRQEGSIVRLPTGGGKFSYLMRINKAWYKQDQKAKQDAIQETEDAIMRTRDSSDKDSGQYGKVKISRS